MTIHTLIVVAAAAVGAVLSTLGTYLVRRWSLARGFVDRPGGHKGHQHPVPLGGGIAVVLAIVVPVLAALGVANLVAGHPPAWLPHDISIHLSGIVAKTPAALGIIAALVVVSVMGVVDDARPLGASLKFLVEFALAVWLVVGLDVRLLSHLGWLPSTLLSILWIVTLTNSLNFLDNMDGLVGGVGLIAAGIFAGVAVLAGQVFVPAWCGLLAGALAGFLFFNFHPASIFLGDAGSLPVGLLLAVLTILTTFFDPAQGQAPVGVLAPLVVMAVPLYDTASVVLLRWRSGASIWASDRRHFSHRLVRRGMTTPKAVLCIWLATLVTALPALLLPRASWPLACGIGVQTLLVVGLVALLESGAREETPKG